MSYRTGSEVVDSLSSQLLLETVARIEQAVDRHLLGSAAVLETAFPQGQGTTSNLMDDQTALRARFWATTALYTNPNTTPTTAMRSGKSPRCTGVART